MKKDQKGFALEYILLAVVIVVIAAVAITLAVTHRHKNTNSPTASSTSQTTKSSNTQSTNPYTGWKTYASSKEKATFKYPGNWTIDTSDQVASNEPNNTDYIALKSPDGKVVVHWTSLITGFGNETSGSYPLNTVTDKTPVSGVSGNYVVSGITTLDGTIFYPWIALENDSNYGILTSGVHGSLDLFMGRNNVDSSTGKPDTALFSTSGVRVNQSAPGLSESQATAYLTSFDMQQAKLILQSFSY